MKKIISRLMYTLALSFIIVSFTQAQIDTSKSSRTGSDRTGNTGIGNSGNTGSSGTTGNTGMDNTGSTGSSRTGTDHTGMSGTTMDTSRTGGSGGMGTGGQTGGTGTGTGIGNTGTGNTGTGSSTGTGNTGTGNTGTGSSTGTGNTGTGNTGTGNTGTGMGTGNTGTGTSGDVTGSSRTGTGVSTGTSAIRTSIEESSSRFMQAINNGDINTALTYYSNDATLLPPDLDIIQGSNGIGNFWTKITSMGLKFDTLTVADVRPSDDGQEVHEIGRYFLKMERPGQAPVSEKGKFLFVWKKQPDNSWKIDTHMWNRSRQ